MFLTHMSLLCSKCADSVFIHQSIPALFFDGQNDYILIVDFPDRYLHNFHSYDRNSNLCAQTGANPNHPTQHAGTLLNYATLVCFGEVSSSRNMMIQAFLMVH